MAINVQSYIDFATAFILENLLPDTCQVYPTVRTNDGSGGYTEAQGAFRTYKTLSLIPCRFNRTRQYRDATPLMEESTITDYYIDLPTDFVCQVDDTILHGGQVYQIRKLSDDSSWRSTKQAYVVSVR